MKKNIFPIAILSSLLALPAMAQETYESAQIATEDLNGTARYVGMGGAMEALGADISTINTNPAGLGLFRRSSISTTFGLSSIGEAKSNNNGFNASINGKTPMSFDQLGFVFTMPTENGNYVNFAFNYNKNRNFNEVLAAANSLRNASQNKGAYIKGLRGSSLNGGFDIALSNNGEYIGYDNTESNHTSRNFSQSDYLLWNAFIPTPDPYEIEPDEFRYNDADGYAFTREQKGYIGEYDFNVSGNHQNQIFWGITIGIKDVHYDHISQYTEYLNLAMGGYAGNLLTTDERTITGTGWNIKGGVIIRPIDESPFRFGFSISTPTWYELTSSNFTRIYNNTPGIGMYDTGKSNESIKYKMFTPWKFGASLGHTFGQDLALGVSYDYSDYGAIDNRIITDEYYDSWDNTYSAHSESDNHMNANTKKSLKGVHTLKVGFESKLTPEFAVRAGYNYVSPMYSKDGVRSTCLNTDGCYYTSTTDYTNWKDTHRVTCGVGYTHDNFSIDLAYQYSSKNGDFYPFESMGNIHDADGSTINNIATATNVKNERHQFMMTLGWKF